MQVLLKIIGGKHAGREIKISVPEFIIGRGEKAHLRPGSDMVSRQHCAIKVADGKVTINDLGSRNGSFVNGQKITEPHTARSGDKIQIGKLQFELLIDPVKPSAKKPKVKDVVEAASRTATTGKKASLEDSISDWLVSDDDDSPFDEPDDFDANETAQFSAEETQEIKKALEEDSEGSEESEEDTAERTDHGGKLPPRPQAAHDDSTDAADDILKKLFNRR